MPRIYTVTFENVSVAAAQDLVQITGASGRMMFILRAWIANVDTSLITGQEIRLRARFLPATVTVGSGGTTGITPSKRDPGDAACSSSTCATNNTTQATTNGTAVLLFTGGTHIYAPFEKAWGDADSLHRCPPIGPSEAFVWELLSTVSATAKMSGGVELAEVGG